MNRCPATCAPPAAALRRPLAFLVLILSILTPIRGAEVDISKLPSSATSAVEFSRDIQPIFEKSCYRCHGPEKPKSRFRLDNRESALKGGEKGIDILPGTSAKSPLVHYVARLVEDMEMPPDGKGEPLTRDQISLVRAWIDQGAPYPTNQSGETFQFTISPSLRFVTVHGNQQKFREDYWQNDEWSGGISELDWKQRLSPDTTFSADGRALFGNGDYGIHLALDKTDVGFVHAGFEQFRKYYNDVGGTYAGFNPSSYALNRDLHLDTGRAWLDLGLTLPHRPRIVLGYEYQFREGAKSLYEWGDVSQGAVTKKIYPSARDISEHVHILKLDVSHEIAGFTLEESFRGEFYRLNTFRQDTLASLAGLAGPTTQSNVREGATHFQGANTFRVEKEIREWWFASAGYFYSSFDGDSALQQSAVDASGRPTFGDHWSTRQIVLEREAHVFNLNSLFGPWQGLSFSVGWQNEWSMQSGLGNLRLDEGNPALPLFYFPGPATNSSSLSEFSMQENFAVRYTQIPYTTLFAEAQFKQDSIGQFERDLGGGQDFSRDTDARSGLAEYRAGLTVSPWRKVSMTATFRRRDNQTDYDKTLDRTPGPAAFAGLGYSAFIRARDMATDEVEAKLSLHPLPSLKTMLSYKLESTDYRTTTDKVRYPFPFGANMPGGDVYAGNYDAHTFSAATTWMPWTRVYFSGIFSYSQTRLETAHNNFTGVAAYQGDVYNFSPTTTFVLTEASDLNVSYSWSRADFHQDNQAGGLPLGIVYDRHGIETSFSHRFKKGARASLGYGFYSYAEPSSQGVNDYTAHAIFATLSMKWP